jgi:hypothetical protein
MKLNISLLIISFFLFSNILSAQTNKNNSYNIGIDPITQGFYIGFDHAIHNYSFGADVGLGIFIPIIVSLSVDNAYYFGRINKYDQKTWHFNCRLAYSKILIDNQPNLLFIIPSFGKTFYLNDKFGINLEIGYGFQLLDEWKKTSLEGVGLYFGGASTPDIRLELKF